MLNIPKNIIDDVESEAEGLLHGIVTLSVHLRDGRARYVISRERSIMPPDTPTMADGGSSLIKNYSAEKKNVSEGMRK